MVSLLASLAVMSFAQTAPTKVQDAFKAKFPTAKSVKWEQENDSVWEAEFKVEGVEYSANFSNDGVWKETEHEIKSKDLPQAVKNALATEFAGYEIEEVEMVESPDFTGYEVEIEKGEVTMEVLIDKSGNVIKKKVKKEEAEKDEKKDEEVEE